MISADTRLSPIVYEFFMRGRNLKFRTFSYYNLIFKSLKTKHNTQQALQRL